MQFIVLSGFGRAIMALSSAPRPRKMTCHNLFITYVYVRSAYLISRQLPQKGELSDFKLPTPGVFLKLCFVVPLHMFVCDSFFPLMQLTPDEEQRRKLRRERNKVAASKCRMKRKEHVNTLRKVSATCVTFARLIVPIWCNHNAAQEVFAICG